MNGTYENTVWDRIPRCADYTPVLIDWDSTIINKFCKSSITFYQYRILYRIVEAETSYLKNTPIRQIVKIIKEMEKLFQRVGRDEIRLNQPSIYN